MSFCEARSRKACLAVLGGNHLVVRTIGVFRHPRPRDRFLGFTNVRFIAVAIKESGNLAGRRLRFVDPIAQPPAHRGGAIIDRMRRRDLLPAGLTLPALDHGRARRCPTAAASSRPRSPPEGVQVATRGEEWTEPAEGCSVVESRGGLQDGSKERQLHHRLEPSVSQVHANKVLPRRLLPSHGSSAILASVAGFRQAAAMHREQPCRRAWPKWRNWQTRRSQNPVLERECGFESHLRQ